MSNRTVQAVYCEAGTLYVVLECKWQIMSINNLCIITKINMYILNRISLDVNRHYLTSVISSITIYNKTTSI